MTGFKVTLTTKGRNTEEEAERQEDHIRRHRLEVKVRNPGGWTSVVAAEKERRLWMQNQQVWILIRYR